MTTTRAPSESDGDIVTVKECVKALFKENGGHKHVMVKLDVGQTRAYGFTDERSEENISFARVAALTSETATAAARYLAQLAGGFFCPLPNRKKGATLAMLAECARSHGEAIGKTAAALADGQVDRSEVPALVKEIDEAICDLASLRGSAVAMAEGE
jgi:hypothetical protein